MKFRFKVSPQVSKVVGILLFKPVSRLPADPQRYLHHIRFPGPGHPRHLSSRHQPGGGDHGVVLWRKLHSTRLPADPLPPRWM